MHYPRLTAVALSILVIFLVISCKKKNNLNVSAIRIAAVDKSLSGGGRFHYHITYDTYNNVDSIGFVGGGTDTGTVGFEKFTYLGSSFTITDQNNNSYTVDAYTNGQIFEVLTIDTMLMTYNGTELAELDYKSPSNTYPFYHIDSTTYRWNNGDMVAFSINGVVDSYSYNPGKSGQVGDALRIENFLKFGRSYIATNHLPDELTFNGAWIEQYFYKLDGSGRITQLIKVTNQSSSTNDTVTYAYTYY